MRLVEGKPHCIPSLAVSPKVVCIREPVTGACLEIASVNGIEGPDHTE